MSTTIGATLALGGEKEFRQAVKQSALQIQTLQTNLNKVTAEFASNNNSIEAYTAKQKALQQIHDEQARKVEIIRQALEKAVAKYGEGSTQVERWQRQLNAAENELSRTEVVIANNNQALQRAENATKDFGDALDNAGNKAITFGDVLKANIIGDLIADGLRNAADAAKEFIVDGIELASDLQEVQNVVDTTFGNSASSIYAWSDKAAEAYGMSSLSAQNYNGTLGAMIKSMGFTTDTAAEMSKTMVGLSGDMASFYNLDVSTAFEKIRSGISGETEPLKQLGINMSVANLEAYRLAQGIETAYSKMSQAEQVTLRYNYLLQATTDAQGDFAKTSDSRANQLKIMHLQLENLSASLGAKLLPKVTEVLYVVNDKLPKAAPVIENIGSLLADCTAFAMDNADKIVALAGAYGAFVGTNAIGNGIITLVNNLKALKTANDAATASQTAMNTAANANPYVLLASAIAALVGGIVVYSNTIETASKNIKNLEKETENAIQASEGEIAVIERKVARYDELRNKTNLTAAETAELADIVTELQGILPAGTEIINAQTGAYNNLAGAVDNVIKSMRQQATLQAYTDEYNELVKLQVEAQERYDSLTNSLTNAGAVFSADGESLGFSSLSEYVNSGLGGATGDWVIARDNLRKYNYALDELEDKIQGVYATNAETAKETTAEITEAVADSTEEVIELEGDAFAEGAKKREEELQAYKYHLDNKVAELDNNLALRKISEDEYYRQLKQYLDNNINTESTAYYEQLEKYENYCNSKAKKAEATETKIVKTVEDTAKAEKQALEKSLQEVTKTYENTLNSIQSKVDSFKSNLMSSYKDVFTFDTDDDGNITKAYTTDVMTQGYKDLETYLNMIDKLKERGISNDLLTQMSTLSIEEGTKVAEYYLTRTDTQLKNLANNWAAYNAKAQELAESLYSTEVQTATQTYINEVQALLQGASPEMKATGLQIVKDLVSAFADTEQLDVLNKHITAMFATPDSVNGVDMGTAYVTDIADGVKADGYRVSDALQQVLSEAQNGLKAVQVPIEFVYTTGVGVSQQANAGNTTIYNQSYEQNNYSPTALSERDIYNNTQQQLQLGKVK